MFSFLAYRYRLAYCYRFDYFFIIILFIFLRFDRTIQRKISPMMRAAESGYDSVVFVLLAAGVDEDATNEVRVYSLSNRV